MPQDPSAPSASAPSSTPTDTDHPDWFALPEALAPSSNLTRLVRDLPQSTSPFDGDAIYEQLFEHLAKGLFRSAPRHVLIARELGVGDQAVLTEFARRAAAGKYVHLRPMQLVRVDCRFLPGEDGRERLAAIFAAVGPRPDLVVCFDGLAKLFAEAWSVSVRSAWMTHLSRCACRVIGVVTPREYEDHFAGRPDTEEFFSTVDLNEPGLDTALRLVGHYAEGLSRQYGVRFEAQAIRRSVVLSDSYIPSKRLPAKAVGILRDVCEDIAYERSQGTAARDSVSEPDVIEKVSKISGVPAGTLAGLPDGVDYREVLCSRIMGQDHVIDEVATELGLIRAGMVDAGKPASVMLFVGQTGTGKTELAKVLAKLYSASKRLKTFTLGNYSEPHSVSGIIGVPAGYVGHDQGGRLVNDLNTDPYSVFLLDEADKAHPDVMQPFLNLFDEGWIVDQRGTKGYAERAIFILTTNVGQRQIAEMQKKGKSWEEINDKLMESLSQIRHAKANRPVFSAEFLARIKRVIIFKSLDEDAMTGITRQLCDDLIQKWALERQKTLVIPDEIVAVIAAQAHQQNEKSKGKEGGRIVRKKIANLIESKLQSAIAQSPDIYRRCEKVRIESSSSEENDAFTVDFV